MSEFQPVETIEDLQNLDQDEVVAGYMAGMSGERCEPGSDKSRSYWHGWRNAMVDRGWARMDVHQQRLAHAMYPCRAHH